MQGGAKYSSILDVRLSCCCYPAAAHLAGHPVMCALLCAVIAILVLPHLGCLQTAPTRTNPYAPHNVVGSGVNSASPSAATVCGVKLALFGAAPPPPPPHPPHTHTFTCTLVLLGSLHAPHGLGTLSPLRNPAASFAAAAVDLAGVICAAGRQSSLRGGPPPAIQTPTALSCTHAPQTCGGRCCKLPLSPRNLQLGTRK
jgi:hypothetical protein